jgi:hypothetical protein
MFGEAFSYIKTNYPQVEAAISSFMPTYASGLSMLTGGFDMPILIKPNEHTFAEKTVGERNVMEHVTKRRQQGGGKEVTSSTLPLLPVVELISPIKQPRFKGSLEIGKEMVSMM